MNILSWYFIEIEYSSVKNFEIYLATLKQSSKKIKVNFSVYKKSSTDGLIHGYYISEEGDYIYQFVINRFNKLQKCIAPFNILNLAVKIF